MNDLDIETSSVQPSELKLALQLIEQISEEAYDPEAYEDDEKKRIQAAIDEKIAGKEIVVTDVPEAPATGQVIDLMEALRASLGAKKPAAGAPAAAKPAAAKEPAKERKGAKRAVQATVVEEEAAPKRARSRK